MTTLNVNYEEALIILSSLNVTIDQQKAFHSNANPVLVELAAKVSEQLAAPESAEVQQVAPKAKRVK